MGEIIQYTFIFLILVTIFTYVLNKYYYKYIPHLKKPKKDTKPSNITIFTNFMLIFFDILILLISFFYIRKIGLLAPSIPALLYKRFIPYTTMDYTVHIALVVYFIELLPNLKERLEIWNEDLYKIEFE
jgi:hypothetical protein